MRAKDICVGGEYFCNVSNVRVKVRVLSDTGKNGARYRVCRVDNSKILDKLRSAQALHLDGKANWPGMTESQDEGEST